jgi:hypothetical protein
MWKRLYVKTFESGVGVYVIANAILTFFPGSSVREGLFVLVGYPGAAVPVFQIFAGLLKLTGLIAGKANLEASGLVMVGSIFIIRAITLMTDGAITLSDINSVIIAVLIVICNSIRVIQILEHDTTIYITRNGHKFQ